jgi:nucleotide-binding universal stress UspA family protein
LRSEWIGEARRFVALHDLGVGSRIEPGPKLRAVAQIPAPGTKRAAAPLPPLSNRLVVVIATGSSPVAIAVNSAPASSPLGAVACVWLRRAQRVVVWPSAKTIRSVDGAIVLDGHQRKKRWHRLRRSTIASVLHLARQPVWVSRARRVPPRHLLCGVDCSGSSREALLLAGELKARLNARLTVVHAIDGPSFNPFGMTAQEEQEQLQAHRRATEEQVRAFVAETGVAAETRFLWGHPAEVIQAVVQHEDVDLVVVGSTGKGALARVVLGSTARRLLADCGCSLLLLGEGGSKAS